MRILHLYPTDPEDPLGPEAAVRLHEIARRLARHHQVGVVSPGATAAARVRDGVHYHCLAPAGRWGGLRYGMALARWLRRHPVDLLVDELVPGHNARWGRWVRPARLRVIASLHGASPAVDRPRPWATLRGYDDVIVPSASIQERVAALPGARRIELVPNGVDDALFRLPAQRGRGLLYLGRVDLAASGVDLLLQAYARVPLAQREPLTLAGPVHDLDALQSVLLKAGLGAQVHVLGACDHRKRMQLLSECRAVVVPARREGALLTVAQANAAGRPVVVWDQGPLSEAASRACLRVPAFDVPAFAQALGDLLQASRDELQLRGLHARAHARRFDWDSAADVQERFYLRCLHRLEAPTTTPEGFDATA